MPYPYDMCRDQFSPRRSGLPRDAELQRVIPSDRELVAMKLAKAGRAEALAVA